MVLPSPQDAPAHAAHSIVSVCKADPILVRCVLSLAAAAGGPIPTRLLDHNCKVDLPCDCMIAPGASTYRLGLRNGSVWVGDSASGISTLGTCRGWAWTHLRPLPTANMGLRWDYLHPRRGSTTRFRLTDLVGDGASPIHVPYWSLVLDGDMSWPIFNPC
jgi:hypothetical protein